MKIKILYEDKDMLIIDKPSGIAVHSDGRSKEKTIADWFLKNYPKAKNVGEPISVDGKEIKRPGIVHRLDKETSGVLVLAKNQKAYEFLKNQFKERLVKKTYYTIVSGWVKNDRGIINKPIGRSPTDFRRKSAGRGARGELKEAITQYKVLKRFTSPPVKGECPKGEGVKFTYLEVMPKTGRTHQIRVHMKYLNHPVVCDSLYDPRPNDGSVGQAKGFCSPLPNLPLTKGEEKGGGLSRLALHAGKIEIENLKGETLKIEAPIPKELKNFSNEI